MRESIYARMRDKERFNVNLKARYRIKDKAAPHQECRITNLSSSGAALRLSDTENLSSGAVIEMDIPIPDTIMHIVAEAEIVWVRQRFNKLISGIRFKSMLSDGMIKQLAKKDSQA